MEDAGPRQLSAEFSHISVDIHTNVGNAVAFVMATGAIILQKHTIPWLGRSRLGVKKLVVAATTDCENEGERPANSSSVLVISDRGAF
jgi:hypothetical protein